MIKTAIVGLGNVGNRALEAVMQAPDMELCCVVTRTEVNVPDAFKAIWVSDLQNIQAFGKVDVAILCLPSRLCPDAAQTLLQMGISTVDSFDIHAEIWSQKCRLDAVAKANHSAAIIAAGWDPGSDSVLRALLEAMTPRGISYTDFGPGMSMGHSVAAKAIEGVENALSVTMPAGAGVHKRIVYVQLAAGANIEEVAQAIRNDPYFIHDETQIVQVTDVRALQDMGHGVHMTRRGVSGNTHNQVMEFTMRINNPALTGQILVSAARAVQKQMAGCYTLIEIPLIHLLPGEHADLIRRLV